MIELKDVKKVFNAGRPNEVSALVEVNLCIDQQATVFKGPSGSGKTTLLSLIGCLARPTSGRIFLRNQEITSLPERFLTLIRRQTFGFIFQQYNLLRGISVLENVMLPAYPSGESYGALKKRASNLIALFNLSDKVGAKVNGSREERLNAPPLPEP
jgi:putative ABC transport system ATP-binding protein